MFRANDPAVIKNGEQRAQWQKEHPESSWKTNLSQEQIDDIERPAKVKELAANFTPPKTSRNLGEMMLESAKHIEYDD